MKIIFTLIFYTFLFSSSSVLADSCQQLGSNGVGTGYNCYGVQPGSNIQIDNFSTDCNAITNNSGGTLFVPTGSQAQWDSFRAAALPANISLNGCSCGATVMNNCTLSASGNGQTSGTCPTTAGWTGSCSYSCSGGSWTQVTNTCALAPCTATDDNGTPMTDYWIAWNNSWQSETQSTGPFTPYANYACEAHVVLSGSYNSGTSVTFPATNFYNGASAGSLTLTCSSSGTFGPTMSSTSPPTCNEPAYCTGQSISNCTLPNAGSGSSASGTCASGYYGSCSYSCSNGNWTQVSNTCSNTCPATTINSCVLSSTAIGSTSGSCTYSTGISCSYTCNSDGTWSENNNSCYTYETAQGGSGSNVCWTGGGCGSGYGSAAACPAGYTTVGTSTACGNPNEAGSNTTLQLFYMVNNWGCPDGYNEGVTVTTCKAQ